MEMTGKHFLITGANRGIGWSVAKMAAKEQAHLHLAIRSPINSDSIHELKELGAESVHIYQTDFANQDSFQTFLKEIKTKRIDILFNNAGLLTGGLLENQPIDEIRSMFQVNVQALVELTWTLIPGMLSRKEGKIINNASVSAIMNFPCASTYAASKAAVVAFTNCLSAETKGTGVSTLCLITPGIKTRMFDAIDEKYSENLKLQLDYISSDEYADQIKSKIKSDANFLFPNGKTYWGLMTAKYLPNTFQWAVRNLFDRNSKP